MTCRVRIFLALATLIFAYPGLPPAHGQQADQPTAGSEAQATDAPAAKRGAAERAIWTSSKFRGRPDPPPPFRARRVFGSLSFDKPTILTGAPGTERMFVAEHGGRIFSITRDSGKESSDLMLDVGQLVKRLNGKSEQPLSLVAVYGLTFHPRFAENGYCYVCYVVRYAGAKKEQHPRGTRVSRLTVKKNGTPKADPASEKLIISWLQGGHNGGCLKFGKDGYLYISTGDGGFAYPPDGRNAGQDVSNLLSAILRIDVDRESGRLPYRIPPDNPFVSLPDARGEIWSFGFRNPWKMSIDRKTGDLWVGDVGWELWELVHRVNKGDNFGWSLVEGRQPVHVERRRGPTKIVPPTVEIPHTEGASVTGGFVYRGKRFPELVGTYIFGDWETRRIWGVNADADQPGKKRELVEPTIRVVGFAEDNAGELYVVDYDDGTIHTLVRNVVSPQAERFPRTLSESGLFADVARHVVAPGVARFEINASNWSDGAVAERFLAIPGKGTIAIHDRPSRVAGSMFSRKMDFPKDSVLLKTLSLKIGQGELQKLQRIESQILHFDGRDWRGYSYRWNEAQSDATLIGAGGDSRTLQIVDGIGRASQHTWRFPSRTDCIRCHNPWAEHTLAFNLPQLNRSRTSTKSENQLQWLQRTGLLAGAKGESGSATKQTARLVDPHDVQSSLDARARSYLHINCAHCHRNGGGGSAYMHLPFELPLSETKSLSVRPSQGAFDIPDAEIIAPSDPFRSMLYYRMAKIGSGHMPHLGAKTVDKRGLQLIHDWIRQLPLRTEADQKIQQLIDLDEDTVLRRERQNQGAEIERLARSIAGDNGRDDPNDKDLKEAAEGVKEAARQRVSKRNDTRSELTRVLLSSPTTSMMLARRIMLDKVPRTTREAVTRLAMTHDSPTVRGLFEAFVPPANRPKRLGESIRPETILALSGNVARGKNMFKTSTVVQCRLCHRIGKTGVEVGPDLTKIGGKRDRRNLLDSLLTPSKNIEPKYVVWQLQTYEGTLHSGLLVEKNDKRVVLKDARNKREEFAIDAIERMIPARVSIMPELLLRDLTAQQAADLLAYLESLK